MAFKDVKQKVIWLILLLSILTGITAACDSDAEKNEVDKINFQDMKPVTLTFYTNSLPINHKEVAQEIAKRTKGTLNIQVEFKRLDGIDVAGYSKSDSIQEDIENVLNSGKPCDAFIGAYIERNHVEEDLFLDITEMFPRVATSLYTSFNPDDIENSKINGRLYYIPANTPISQRFCVVARKDLIEKYKIHDIQTFEDYEVFLDAVRDESQYVSSDFGMSGWWDASFFMENNGYVQLPGYMVYKRDDPEMKVIPWEQTIAFSNAVATLKRWADRQLIKQRQLGKSYASFISYMNSVHLYKAWAGMTDTETVVYPLYPDRIVSRGADAISSNIAISKNSPNPDRVLQFLEWVYSSQENYDLVMYGITGVNYELADQRIKMIPDGYGRVYEGFLDMLNYAYIRPFVSDPPNMKELYRQAIETNTETPPHQKYSFDLNEYNTQFNDAVRKRNDAFSNLMWTFAAETNKPFGGILAIDVQDFIEQQKKAGADVLAAGAQEILNEAKKAVK